MLIAGLVVVELAIAGGAVNTIRGEQPAAWPGPLFGAGAMSGAHPMEAGAHQMFLVGLHPALTVDIGYADLTIISRNAPQIDVAVNSSDDFGPLRSRAPITARKDGDAIRIAADGGRQWSLGDNRMVTVVVPPQTLVTVVHAGIIKATGLRAEASFYSIGQGTVTVEDYRANALHASSNGQVSLHDVVASRVDVTSRDDRVEGTGLQLRYGSIESHDGRVTLGFAAGTDTMVFTEAGDGKIDASGFGPTAAVARKNSDGDDDDSSAQTLRIGTGNGRLDVHSREGNVDLIQEAPART